MAKINTAHTICYFATDTSDGSGKISDAANHTLKVVADGTMGSVTASPAAVSDSDVPGLYKVVISSSENTGEMMILAGKSSTSGISISPVQWTNVCNVAQVSGVAEDIATETKQDIIDTVVDSIESKVDNIANTGSPTNAIITAYSLISGSPSVTNTYAATGSPDGTYHQFEETGTMSFTYDCQLLSNAAPTELYLEFILQGSNDDFTVEAYNDTATTWREIGTLNGTVQSTSQTEVFKFTANEISDTGLVKIRFTGTDLTSANLRIDYALVSFSTSYESVGYANGAIWVDTENGTAGTTAYINGTADNPVNTWADALTLSGILSLNKFEITNGSTITLTADSSSYDLIGQKWTLALGGQNISNAYIQGATVSGTSSGTGSKFKNCRVGAATISQSGFEVCGFGVGSGTFTAGSIGQYTMFQCFSLVPGSGSPSFVFSGQGDTVGINNRGWCGGATYTLDDKCTLSHEVLAGGGTTVTTGGGDVEIRGITRSVTITASGTGVDAETIQFNGITGPITLNGTTEAVFNLYGVSAGVTDNTSAGVITDKTVSRDNINIEADTAISDGGLATSTEISDLQTHGDSTWTTATVTTPPTVEAIRAEIDSNSTQLAAIVEDTGTTIPTTLSSMAGATFNTTTDSLEAIRNQGDSAWVTGAGGSSPTAEEIRTEMDNNSTKLAAIVADTNELQTDDIPGKLAALEVHGDSTWTTAVITSLATADALTTVGNNVTAVKAKTDSLTFEGTDVKATLDGEEVTTDEASRLASRAILTGIATSTNVTNSTEAILEYLADDLNIPDTTQITQACSAALSDGDIATTTSVYNLLAAVQTHGDSTWATASISTMETTIEKLDTMLESDSSTTYAFTTEALANSAGSDTSAIEAVTAKLDTMLEADGLVYTYTADALKNGPVGESGDIPTKLDTIVRYVERN